MHRPISPLPLVIIGALLHASAPIASAQEPPSVPGVTGTLALEGTVDRIYSGANTVIVKATDGIEHLFHLTKGTTVHGADQAEAAFAGLTAGSRVVVHYALDGGEKTAVEVDRIGADGLAEMQGVITRVDRDAKRLSIRLADGSKETLQLTDRAAGRAGDDTDRDGEGAPTVVVYYRDEGGAKVAHYFKKISEDF